MKSIQHLVVAVDFGDESKAALARAECLARAYSATLHLVHGVRTPSYAMSHDFSALSGSWAAARETANHEMKKLQAELEAKGFGVATEVTDRDPVHAVVGAAEELHADLVVIGTHGHTGFKHALLGSVAESVLRRAPCPVLTVREDVVAAAAPIARIVAATDLSANSEPAVAWAFGLAAELAAEVELVHAFSFEAESFPHTNAWNEEIAEKELAVTQQVRAQAETQGRAGAKAQVRVLRGDTPASLISRHASEQGAGLVVMGTHGYTGFRHAILGSVAEQTLRAAKCSVVTVRAEE